MTVREILFKLKVFWKTASSRLFFLNFKDKKLIYTYITIALFLLILPVSRADFYRSFDQKSAILRSPLRDYQPPSSLIVSRQEPFPAITARGLYIYEQNSQTLLFEQNSRQQFYPASTTKIATALVALEQYKPDQVLTIPNFPKEGQVVGLEGGEQYYFKDLLYGLLVQSGNDAALAMAYTYPGGLDSFVSQMNQLVADLSLTNTHFTNPTGIDNWQHYSTPHDLAILAQKAMTKEELRQAVATKDYQITDLTGQHKIKLENLNLLLGQVDGLQGIKTGWTELAGECLIGLVKRGDWQVLTVVLNSHDRFGDTAKIIKWVFDNFQANSNPGIQ
jgi:D-alanyl-D-alanine carboxypeptidase (penicillin-binding protein 5/6)